MSPADLALVPEPGSRADLLARVTALVKVAANAPVAKRAEKVTEAAHGIVAIILEQRAGAGC